MTGSELESADAADRPRPWFSRFYAVICERMEAEGMAELRRELLADLTGDIVERARSPAWSRSNPSRTCVDWPALPRPQHRSR